MKNIWKNIALLAVLTMPFAACKKNDTHSMDDLPHYHAHILSPDASDKHVGDTLHIEIEFEEHDGKTIHHINVRIFNKNDGTEIYNQPQQAHIHETSGYYKFTDDFVLDVDPHTDWVLEARVWGHEDGVAEVTETVEFHVHP